MKITLNIVGGLLVVTRISYSLDSRVPPVSPQCFAVQSVSLGLQPCTKDLGCSCARLWRGRAKSAISSEGNPD